MATNHKEEYKRLMAGMGKIYKNCPGVADGFGKLHDGAMAEGALTTKEKELIALGIGIAIRCTGCITAHVKAALDAGATPEEIYETISVVVMMAGGPGTAYGLIAIEALEDFTA